MVFCQTGGRGVSEGSEKTILLFWGLNSDVEIPEDGWFAYHRAQCETYSQVESEVLVLTCYHYLTSVTRQSAVVRGGIGPRSESLATTPLSCPPPRQTEKLN